ncbi:hypothetical protein DLJ82_5930 (plasmid) [Rhizobium leguminosarum]|uniref:Uncharacterized protein n=1 Tax=Rhizobium leguminosarum TaxID=384 RepID=A0A2Z4YRI4_RHILE|nr:hypothetical protein DLJ82_5930 [Rhizobium leguminosarum]
MRRSAGMRFSCRATDSLASFLNRDCRFRLSGANVNGGKGTVKLGKIRVLSHISVPQSCAASSSMRESCIESGWKQGIAIAKMHQQLSRDLLVGQIVERLQGAASLAPANYRLKIDNADAAQHDRHQGVPPLRPAAVGRRPAAALADDGSGRPASGASPSAQANRPVFRRRPEPRRRG